MEIPAALPAMAVDDPDANQFTARNGEGTLPYPAPAPHEAGGATGGAPSAVVWLWEIALAHQELAAPAASLTLMVLPGGPSDTVGTIVGAAGGVVWLA